MKSVLALFLILLISCSKQNPQKDSSKLSPTAFTEQFAKELRKSLPSSTVTIRKDMELIIKDSTGTEQMSFLFNAYKEYQQDTTAVQEIIERYIGTVTESDKFSDTIDISRIVPVVKDADYIVEMNEAMTKAGYDMSRSMFYFEPLNAELIVMYAEDTDKSLKYLTASDIDSLCISRDSLKSHALTNLDRIMPKIQRHGDSGIYMLTCGGTFESSLLLFNSIWNEKTLPVDGRFVVAIPSRDVLLVTGENDSVGINRLNEQANQILKSSSYQLTDQLFVRENDKWKPITP